MDKTKSKLQSMRSPADYARLANHHNSCQMDQELNALQDQNQLATVPTEDHLIVILVLNAQSVKLLIQIMNNNV
jgi:hypothetical protein